MAGYAKDAQGLTEMQKRFVGYYVRLGANAAEAARLAGFSRGKPENAKVRGYELLHLDHVQAAIRREAQRYLSGELAMRALKTLGDYAAGSARSESVTFQAALALLDRGGYRHSEVIEIKDNYSPEERRERILELQRRLFEAQNQQLNQQVMPSALIVAKGNGTGEDNPQQDEDNQ